ncbi:MAG TPA: SRPBCC family protein [Burkholderiales bacterium]|jgi:carbon monoxide dehydrogenase subunit G|nr:SRPBCC family protein [Burkholderiales bacterium]
MFKTIAIVVVALVAALLVYAATKPDTFRVQRSASIKAPPAKIFAILNDFQRWDAWSPWEKKDPAMKRTFSVVTSGKGAQYAWQGNSDVGQGRMEIAESTPPSKVAIKLDFVKPFETHNLVEFTLEPQGDATNVTWAMQGPSPYIAKVMQVFFSMDKMVGKDFEAGLANLKALAEK